MQAMQTTRSHPHRDRRPPHPRLEQLPPRHHPVLPSRQLGYSPVVIASP